MCMDVPKKKLSVHSNKQDLIELILKKKKEITKLISHVYKCTMRNAMFQCV